MTDNDTTDDAAPDDARNITEMARDQLSSRRGFLAGSTALGAGALGASGFGSVMANEHGDDSGSGGMNGTSNESGDSNGSDGSGDDTSDVDILNYALTLEHLEATFYAKGLEDFSDEEFVNADVACNLCDQMREMIPEHVEVVGEHEAAHVDTISSTIEDLGGDPVEQAEYDFGYETPSEFLELAMTFENTGVAAYAGAGPSIENDELVAAALSIHSVEARHAAIFNAVNGTSPFPNAFDEPQSMDEVTEAVSDFILSE